MLNKNIVFCFTGKGPLTRDEMEATAIKAGASITKSVNNKTTILVIMDMNSQSTKAKKARELGIDLIGPNTFLAMCSTGNYSTPKPEVKLEMKTIEAEVKRPLRKIVLD